MALVYRRGTVQEYEKEGRDYQAGADDEGPGEPRQRDHEPEQKGSHPRAGIEGRIPECAPETVLGFRDASHHQDEGGILKRPEPEPEDYRPNYQDHTPQR